jgi:uncharacterized membrane protein HdeD (DUF308 family)
MIAYPMTQFGWWIHLNDGVRRSEVGIGHSGIGDPFTLGPTLCCWPGRNLKERAMNAGLTGNASSDSACDAAAAQQMRQEFGIARKEWCWLLLLGILLTASGVVAIVFPAATVVASLTTVVFLGVLLMAAGFATILGTYRAGKWSGMLLHLFIGILYVIAGFLILDSPRVSVLTTTLLIAVIFMVSGIFRIVAAMVLQFPKWGWALLNGAVTLLAGIVIYRHFPESAFWVIGLLVGLELLFSGWTWIMLAICVRRASREAV